MGKKQKANNVKSQSADLIVVAENRKAKRDYEIIDSIECGIVLLGSEVKSIRSGGMNLKDSYVAVKNGEMFLVGAHIGPYSHSRVDAHAPERERKLLLHRREIDRLAARAQQKGLTIIPLKAFFINGRCKLEIAIGKGKKFFDKREDVKARQANRAMERVLKRS